MVRWNVWCQTNGSLFGCATTAGCWWWPVWRNNKKSRSNARKTSQTCCFYSSTPWHWVNFNVKCIFAHFLQYFPWKRAQNNWSKLFLMVETPIAVPLYKRYTCLVRLNFEIVFWTAISMWFFEGCLPDYWLPFFILRRDFPSKSQTSSLVWDIEKWKLKQEVQLDIW